MLPEDSIAEYSHPLRGNSASHLCEHAWMLTPAFIYYVSITPEADSFRIQPEKLAMQKKTKDRWLLAFHHFSSY